jgi:hypothetical protein
MRALTLVLTPLLLAACAGSSPGSAASTLPPSTAAPAGSPSAGAQALAALVDFPNGTGPQSTGYDLALVGTDGHVAAHTHAAARSFIGSGGSGGGAAAIDLPQVSAANGRVYYLDGDQNLRSLTPTGTTSDVLATLPGTRTAHAGFAVSPDGHTIAVAVLAYSGSTASVSSLYVEDLPGGNRHDISHTGAGLVWPVGWHGNDLVLAAAANGFSQQGLAFNPYFAAGFQLVDPATSNRVATIGGPDASSGCQVTGLVVPAGTACVHQTSSPTASELWLLNWTGARTDTLTVQRPAPSAALNPDQQSVGICCDASGAVLLAQGHGTPAATALEGSPDSWPCWVDDQHLLAGAVNDHAFRPGVLAAASGSVARVTDAHGFCAAVLGSAGAAGEPM